MQAKNLELPAKLIQGKTKKFGHVVASPSAKPPTVSTATIGAILAEMEHHGYRRTNTNTKLSEFRAPNDQSIYVIHAISKSDFVSIMLNPNIEPELIRRLNGVESVDREHRFHSNMPRFPRRKNNGKDEITYGWKVHIASMEKLKQFLDNFGSTKF